MDVLFDVDQWEVQDQVSLVELVVVMDKLDEIESVIDLILEQCVFVEQFVFELAECVGVVGKIVVGVSDWFVWLGMFLKGDYVIQLLGVKEWKMVEIFVNCYFGVKNFVYYCMVCYGVFWYVVVQVSYLNYDVVSVVVIKLL